MQKLGCLVIWLFLVRLTVPIISINGTIDLIIEENILNFQQNEGGQELCMKQTGPAPRTNERIQGPPDPEPKPRENKQGGPDPESKEPKIIQEQTGPDPEPKPFGTKKGEPDTRPRPSKDK